MPTCCSDWLTLALGRTALLAFAFRRDRCAAVPVCRLAGLHDATHDFGFIRCLYGFATGVLVQAAFVQLAEKPTPDMETRLTWTFTECAVVLAVGLFVATSFAGPFSLAAPFVFALAVFVFAHEAGYVSRLLRAPIFPFPRCSVLFDLHDTFVHSGRMLNAGKLVKKLPAYRADRRCRWRTGICRQLGIADGGAMLAAVIAASWLTYRHVEVPAATGSASWRSAYAEIIQAKACRKAAKAPARLTGQQARQSGGVEGHDTCTAQQSSEIDCGTSVKLNRQTTFRHRPRGRRRTGGCDQDEGFASVRCRKGRDGLAPGNDVLDTFENP